MSRYKLMKYSDENNRDPNLNWQVVDYELRLAIEKYNEL